jgi:hypothetical protein
VPLVLRGIKKKERWDKDKVYADYEWLKPNLIPPSCFIDLADPRNELSLWYIEDENDPNKEHICAAIACRRSKLEAFQYVLFDKSALDRANILLAEINGETPDDSINHLHRDIEKLTAHMLMQFLEAVWAEARTDVIFEKKLAEIILTNVESNRIDRNRVSAGIRKDLKI